MSALSTMGYDDMGANARISMVAAALSRVGCAWHDRDEAGNGGEGGAEVESVALSTLGWDGGEVVVIEPAPQAGDARERVEQLCQALQADPSLATWRIRPMVLGVGYEIHRIWVWPQSGTRRDDR